MIGVGTRNQAELLGCGGPCLQSQYSGGRGRRSLSFECLGKTKPKAPAEQAGQQPSSVISASAPARPYQDARGCPGCPRGAAGGGVVILQAKVFRLVGRLNSLPEQQVGTFPSLSPSRRQKRPAARGESNKTQGLTTYDSEHPGSTLGGSRLSSQDSGCRGQRIGGGQGCQQVHSDFEASLGCMRPCFYLFNLFFICLVF